MGLKTEDSSFIDIQLKPNPHPMARHLLTPAKAGLDGATVRMASPDSSSVPQPRSSPTGVSLPASTRTTEGLP